MAIFSSFSGALYSMGAVKDSVTIKHLGLSMPFNVVAYNEGNKKATDDSSVAHQVVFYFA